MEQIQDQIDSMVASGWKLLGDWRGICPGKPFYAVVSNSLIQKFICGAILVKQSKHGKIIDGEMVPIGNDRIWIFRVTETGAPSGGMSGEGFMLKLCSSLEEAQVIVDKSISLSIVKLRNDAEALLARAAELEANPPSIEILDFSVDSGEIPL